MTTNIELTCISGRQRVRFSIQMRCKAILSVTGVCLRGVIIYGKKSTQQKTLDKKKYERVFWPVAHPHSYYHCAGIDYMPTKPPHCAACHAVNVLGHRDFFKIIGIFIFHFMGFHFGVCVLEFNLPHEKIYSLISDKRYSWNINAINSVTLIKIFPVSRGREDFISLLVQFNFILIL